MQVAFYTTFIVSVFLLIQVIRFASDKRFLSSFLNFTVLIAWVLFTLALIYFVILIGMNHASSVEKNTILYISIFHVAVGVILVTISYRAGKKVRQPIKIVKKEHSLLDEAKDAYIRRDYEQAYQLFCKAELSDELDNMSLKFKEISNKRIKNI